MHLVYPKNRNYGTIVHGVVILNDPSREKTEFRSIQTRSRIGKLMVPPRYAERVSLTIPAQPNRPMLQREPHLLRRNIASHWMGIPGN